MPKVIAMTARQKMLAEDKAADDALRRRIRATMGALDLNAAALSLQLGCSRATFDRKFKEPGQFTVQEMRTLRRLDEKARALMGGDENHQFCGIQV